MRLRALAAAALVALAACSGGGGDDDDVATLAEQTGAEETTSTTVDPEEAMLAFAGCMRDHGVDFPDPGPDGEVRIEVDEADEAAWAAADEACDDLRPEMAPMTDDQQSELADQLLAQAACMRDHGWDMPDPEIITPADGGVQFRYPHQLDIDVDDPEYQTDHRACVEETGLDEGLLTGGGGGVGG